MEAAFVFVTAAVVEHTSFLVAEAEAEVERRPPAAVAVGRSRSRSRDLDRIRTCYSHHIHLPAATAVSGAIDTTSLGVDYKTISSGALMMGSASIVG